METVWRAVQLSTSRNVALKVLARGVCSSEKARARFEREVELTARLQHPHIARVFDSGVHQGVHYYVMELIDGAPLDRYIEEHRGWLPHIDQPPAPGSAERILTYNKATDETVWEGTPVNRSDPVPESTSHIDRDQRSTTDEPEQHEACGARDRIGSLPATPRSFDADPSGSSLDLVLCAPVRAGGI